MIYYFLTIDKCKTDYPPSIKDYEQVMCKILLFRDCHRTGIECYETKHKSKIFPRWLHYHTIISACEYLRYSEFKHQNYSLKLKLLKYPADIIRVAKYIQKDKIDNIAHGTPPFLK